MSEKIDPNALAITVLRIGVGMFFIVLGQYKVFGTEFTLHGGFEDDVSGFLKGGVSYPFMVPLLQWILAHCAKVVAFSVAYGEFLIGVSLVTGVLARVASVFGFLLMIGLWLSGGYPRGGHAAFWVYWAASLDWTILALCFAALFIGCPDDHWSARALWRAPRDSMSLLTTETK